MASLDPKVADRAMLDRMLDPCAEDVFAAYELGRFVSNTRNEGHLSIEPLDGTVMQPAR